MSSLVNPGLPAPGPVHLQSQNMQPLLNQVKNSLSPENLKISHQSDSESESDSFSEEESSDDDKQIDDNPILKERLKQLDRYATPIQHSTRSPAPIAEQMTISNLYTSNLQVNETTSHNGALSNQGKCGGLSEVAESCSTVSEYRCHQVSVTESPTVCSGPASLNTSVTPKHNFSPSYGILTGTGNSSASSQHETMPNNSVYSHLIGSLPCKPQETSFGYAFGTHLDKVDSNRMSEACIEDRHEYICDVCKVVYSNRSSLQSHMKKHINHVLKRHQCDQCPYSTQYGKNLLKHIESMHSAGKSHQFRCEGCCRCFQTEEMLREHECVLSQCNTYRCNECGRVFKTKLRLKYHADIHNPRKPYVCDVDGCDRAFRTPKYLKNHRDEFHRMQPKNYVCPVEGCDLIFHRKTHLKRHISTHDDAEKKYHCQWPSCQRRFCSEETLNLHYRKHTGEKPFNCALCAFSCYNKPSLNDHYRLQHAKDATVEGPYKSFDTHMDSSVSQRLPVPTSGMKLRHESDGVQGRSSTPVPAVRHRMADILQSCVTQQPGPLDAEINGILDSLDKESDLPDLFSSGTFDFEHSNPGPPSFRGPIIHHSTDSVQHRYDRSMISSTESQSTRPELVRNPENREDENECSLTAVLTTVLADLQKAELSGSAADFERAKTNALAVLPTFSTGIKLDDQINEIVDQILEAVANQPFQFLQAMFHSARQFTRDESYMIESLEHQLSTETPLSAPCPPRRRGRRPKLQQQLQPYLERIYELESSTAEAMASHLVGVAQMERGTCLYDGYYSDVGYSHNRVRGRGGRHRGRAGRPLSLTLRLLPDGTATRTSLPGHNLSRTTARGAMIANRRIRGSIRGRYRIERHPSDPIHTYSSTADASPESSGIHDTDGTSHPTSDPVSNFKDPGQFTAPLTTHVVDGSLQPDLSQTEDGVTDESVQLRASNRSCVESDEELDELEELDDGEEEVVQADYDSEEVKQGTVAHCDQLVSETNSAGAIIDPSGKTDVNVNQDTLGEMLEDLGVIVRRIGERAAARRNSCLRNSPAYRQSTNLSEYIEDEQQATSSVASTLLSGCRTMRNRNDAPAIQLPSMASLASGSVGTPASHGGSTPGCLSNADVLSPRLSSVHSHHPTPGPHGSSHSHTPLSDVNTVNSENHMSGPTNLSNHRNEYRSPQSEFSRTAPMWSCESMCCPTTRDSRSENLGLNGPYPTLDVGPVPNDLRDAVAFIKKEGSCSNQSYHPTDLSTRILDYNVHSPGVSPSSSRHNRSPLVDDETSILVSKSEACTYPRQLSSSAAAMGSLMSAVEAVDHLRSLSALGAKYTASLGMNDDENHGAAYQHRPPGYTYPPVDRSPSSNRMESVSPLDVTNNPSQNHTPDVFTSPHMPSALNNLLCRDRKGDCIQPPSLGISETLPRCGSPSKLDFSSQMIPGSFTGAYPSYNPSNRERTEHCVGNTQQYPLASVSNGSSMVATSSSSARSYLQELYQQREYQQQQLQHQQSRGVKSPVYDLTTRQLLSEAAATAYAHGLGRCDGQNFMTGLPVPHAQQQMSHSASPPPRGNPYAHQSGSGFPVNHYNRYHPSESNSYTHSGTHSDTSEVGFHPTHFGAAPYMSQADPYNLYQQQLRHSSHSHALSRSIDHNPSQPASHLAHSIHEVSGLAAAEAAAAAAYAYHQYHQQQQAHRHGLSTQASNAHAHYQNLFNQNPRSYYTGQLDEQFSPRDLALYTATHPERRDPKSAYLAETYRGSHATPGRFLF